MDTPYEAAAVNEMIAQARRCAQLEMALEKAAALLRTIAREECVIRSDLVSISDLLARIDDVLGAAP